MSLAVYVRHLVRELRGSRAQLLFFVACLAIGVGAVVGVAGFCDAIERGIRGNARQLLAADLAIRGNRPIPSAAIEALDAIPGARRAETREMLTLIAAVGDPSAVTDASSAPRSLLAEIKSTTQGYPFYGQLTLDPARPLVELLGSESVVVAPEVLGRLDLEIGDMLRIGAATFRITGTVGSEPDRIGGAFSLGPRVLVSAEGLARSELERTGSRVGYSLLVALPATAEVDSLAQTLQAEFGDAGRYRVETYREAQPGLRRGLRRTERYLGLAALLSLLVGGVGVAQTVRAWVASRLDALAVLKCLGYRPRQILALDFGQTAALGILASLVGIGLGLGAQAAAAWLLVDILPAGGFSLWQPGAMARGLALGTGVAALFAVPPLLAAQRVPPIRVLRRDAEPVPPGRFAQAALATILVVGVWGLASAQGGNWRLGAQFVGGVVAVVLVLAAAARLLMWLAARPWQGMRLWLRQGLSALARPAAGTLGATVALGLGLLVVVLMAEVEDQLTAQLRRELPSEAPTAFLIDIQRDQWPGVEELLVEQGVDRIDSVPVIMARLAAIDGVSVEEIAPRRSALEDASASDKAEREGRGEDLADDREGQAGAQRWALRREQRLTYLEELPADNHVVDGALWSLPDVKEVSVEIELAEALGAKIGTELRFDIQGVPIDLTVSSLRTVDWGAYGINFYLVAEPGALDAAPQHRIAAARLPDGGEQAVQDALAASYPNVTLIRTREVLEKLAAVLDQLGRGVRLLGLFTVFSGLAILAGAVAVTALARGREVALLKALGMTRRQVMARFAVELAAVGSVAGVLGSAGGGALAWLVLERYLEIPWTFAPGRLVGAAALAVLLSVVVGLVASRRALVRRPIEVLRDRA